MRKFDLRLGADDTPLAWSMIIEHAKETLDTLYDGEEYYLTIAGTKDRAYTIQAGYLFDGWVEDHGSMSGNFHYKSLISHEHVYYN